MGFNATISCDGYGCSREKELECNHEEVEHTVDTLTVGNGKWLLDYETYCFYCPRCASEIAGESDHG
jgi:hypothetical protein